MEMVIKIEKQSSKFIKPIVQTPPTLSHYKLGFIDELAPVIDIGVVLFFSANNNYSQNSFDRLEESLGKTLTRLYPLAGRYVDKTGTIDCNDHGAELIYAKANIKLQDFIVSEVNVKFIDEFIPTKIGVSTLKQSDPLLAAQVTSFECGGVAIGVSATHKIVDASTLSTFINEWAVTNRGENEVEFRGPGFNSSLLFPACRLSRIQYPPLNKDDILSKYTRTKLSFSESVISNMKAKENDGMRRWSKVQMVAAIIWNTLISVDLAKYDFRRESILVQAINLREKMASIIPKTSCGNLWGFCATECKSPETTKELTNRLSDSVKKNVNNFLKGHHSDEEGQAIVLNSYSNNICESTNAVFITSWCSFPFYEADFGFGKPIWAAPATMPIDNTAFFMDDAEGNGVEAYVFLEAKNVPYFEEALVNAWLT